MEKEFDIFENLELTDEEKKYYEERKKISKLIAKLIKRRIELKLSQRDLAKLTGIKQPMIARIENITTIPQVDTLIKIANALELELSFENKISVDINVTIKTEITYNTGNYYDFSNLMRKKSEILLLSN